jgi:hypothetical protein
VHTSSPRQHTPSKSKRHARMLRGNPNRPDSIDRISLLVSHQEAAR